MTTDELATKLAGKVEFMIKQYLPAPTCTTKQQAHKEQVQELKRLIAHKIYPPNHGLTIEIKV